MYIKNFTIKHTYVNTQMISDDFLTNELILRQHLFDNHSIYSQFE